MKTNTSKPVGQIVAVLHLKPKLLVDAAQDYLSTKEYQSAAEDFVIA